MADPAETALTDQAQAAEAHARKANLASGERRGATYTRGPLTGASAAIAARLSERVAARQLMTCPHIDARRPQRQFWFAWAPDAIHCGPCAQAIIRPGARPCDNCGEAIGHVVVRQLPSLVDGEQFAAVGPTTMMTVLCNGCDPR